MRLRVRASELRPGDVMRGSRQTVLSRPLPSGPRRVGLTVRTAAGRIDARDYRADTKIGVERPCR